MTDNIREWFIGQNETKRVSIRFYYASLTRSSITIRYDTRCYINVRSKANMSQLNLPHGTDN